MPVIIYSAYLDHISAKVLMREGADLVLSKPAPLDVFIHCVQNLLNPQKDATTVVVQGYQLKSARNEVLSAIIQKALRKFPGHLDEAAALLGIHLECLKILMGRLGIPNQPQDISWKKIA